jgi:hypothetical protein
MQNRPAGPGRTNPLLKIILVVLVIAIIAGAYYFLYLYKPVNVITLSSTFNISQGHAAYFELQGSGNVIGLYLANSSPYSASFLMSRLPVLEGQVASFSLAGGTSINVSTEISKSASADIEVKLVHSSNSEAEVMITRIPSGFYAPQSGSVSISNPTAPSNSGSSGITATSVITTSVPTTSIPNSGSTTIATTSTPTTTIAQNINAGQDALVVQAANQTSVGSIMHGFESIYSKEGTCTPDAYNTSFRIVNGYSPYGVYSYQNVTSTANLAYFPTGVTASASQISGNLYMVNYTLPTGNPKYTGGPSIEMTFNYSSFAVVNAVYLNQFEGWNYTHLKSVYSTETGIGNGCAAFIP